jgi:fibro-slime domain-containing protein
VRLLAAGSVFALGFAVLAACGARTGLLVPDVICQTEAAVRPCSDACGAGSQTCEDGFWSECRVPIATRSCSDGCGSGEQRCEDGAWQSCQVALVQRDCASVCGAGHETCRNGTFGKCDAPQPKPPKLVATVRDFSPTTHPDFEAAYKSGVDAGMVLSTLGMDGKPVYASVSRTQSSSGRENFDKWYHDDSVNRSGSVDLPLLPSEVDGQFEYDNRTFFPIEGQLLGNEGRLHNYHFTIEASTTFEYRGGEVFSFAGDDDMWVFVNRQLAIDLGGLHPTAFAEIAIDSIAGAFGMSRGNIYPLHFFFAERHTTASRLTLRTTIAEPGSCD